MRPSQGIVTPLIVGAGSLSRPIALNRQTGRRPFPHSSSSYRLQKTHLELCVGLHVFGVPAIAKPLAASCDPLSGGSCFESLKERLFDPFQQTIVPSLI